MTRHLVCAGVLALAVAPAVRAEPAAAPAAAPGGGGYLLQWAAEADANADGVITREEVRAKRSETFDNRDADLDGYLTEAELPKPPEGAGGRFARFRGGEGGLGRLDADGDAKVSRAEFVEAPQPGFDRADANGDGAVTREELDAVKARFGRFKRGGAEAP